MTFNSKVPYRILGVFKETEGRVFGKDKKGP